MSELEEQFLSTGKLAVSDEVMQAAATAIRCTEGLEHHKAVFREYVDGQGTGQLVTACPEELPLPTPEWAVEAGVEYKLFPMSDDDLRKTRSDALKHVVFE